jgi:hypothetical protein
MPNQLCQSAFDWQATGSMLQGLGTLLGALAVLIAAKLGANTFQSWKREKLAEKHIDQATLILTAAYRARRALQYVRGIMMWGHELTSAEDKLKEDGSWLVQTDDRKKRLITAQAYYNRLNRTKEEQGELDRCLPMARALFGEELEKAIETLNHQFWVVQVDVDSYVDDDGISDPSFSKKIRRGMYAIEPSNGEINEVSKAVEEAVSTIERLCLPTLRQ